MIIGISGPISIAPLIGALDIPSGFNVPKGLGGTPVVALVQGLLRRNHRVVVFTLDYGVADEVILKGRFLTIYIGPYRGALRARDAFRTERGYLLSAMLREPTDIIHAQWTYEFAMSALDSGTPTLVTAHDAPLRILRHFRDPYRFMRLLMAWNVSRRAQHLTAVSSHVAEHYRRYLRHRHPITIIPNALPESIFEIGRPANGDVRRSKCKDTLTVATVLTGWNRLKNGTVALEAFNIFRKQMPHARLVMFGGDYAPGGAAERWARANALNEGVEFAGALPYDHLLRRLASEADILLHPSREESFGMAVAEAMALGLAIIGGRDAGAIPFLLEDGKAGELVDVSSPHSVANALLKLGNDSALRQELSAAAHASSYRRFRAGIVFDQYEALYRQIC